MAIRVGCKNGFRRGWNGKPSHADKGMDFGRHEINHKTAARRKMRRSMSKARRRNDIFISREWEN